MSTAFVTVVSGLVSCSGSALSVVPDIICLQETHCVSLDECHIWCSSSGYLFAVSPGSVKSCGCIILFRPSLSLVNSWCDSDGCFLQREFSFLGKTFRVACVYAPNRNPARNQFLDKLHARLDPLIPSVLSGDFNTAFDRSLNPTRSHPNDTSRESTAALITLFDACCCLDIWRYLHPSSSSFSWTQWDGTLSSCIDLVGCPFVWVSSVSSCDPLPCPFPDHCAIALCDPVPDVVPPGPGLWKFNTSVLEKDAHTSLVSSFWTDWCDQKHLFSSLSEWWEEDKAKIKGLTISYCTQRSSQSSQLQDFLSRLADLLKALVDAGLLSFLGTHHSTLSQIARLDLQKAKGAQIHSRICWTEEGETSSAYFFRLERKRAADSWISALRESDGCITSSPTDLCRSFASFYSSLFTASPTDPVAQESLLSNVSSVLSPDQAKLCEGPLTVGECQAALLGMAKRKAPWLDRLPMEFYTHFWHVLGSALVDTLNSCYDSGFLAPSQRRDVISLVFKKGDRLDACNWRPISLPNLDYKLAAHVLSGCLLKVIHHMVSKDQTCGVPGRFIGENVALLRDVVDYATRFDVPVAILSLDQEKAFDHVDWGFMLSTLSKMGFGPSFINWVYLLYTDVSSTVKVNGYLSSFFRLTRGLRQDCPLSLLLYVLVSEVLAANIRANPRITGLSRPGVPTPLSPIYQYADDASLILCSDQSIVACFETYSLVEKDSGAKLNKSKSKGLWLGPWSGQKDPPVALDWSPTKLKVLGVFIGAGNLEEDNWLPRISAVENVLASWKHQSLISG